jgi:hypothetical protein
MSIRRWHAITADGRNQSVPPEILVRMMVSLLLDDIKSEQ